MTHPITAAFVGGVLAAGYGLCGVHFLLFWRRTRDGLFLAFAMAFWLMSANQALPALHGFPRESQGGAYLLRLAAFVVIIVAILWKNMMARRS